MTFPYLSEAVARNPFVFVCATGTGREGADLAQTCWLMDSCTLYASFTPMLFNLSHRVHTLCKEGYGHGGRDVQSSKRHAGYKYGVTQARLVFWASSVFTWQEKGHEAEWKALRSLVLRLPSSSSGSIFMLIDRKEQRCVTWIVIVFVCGFEESPWNVLAQAPCLIRSTHRLKIAPARSETSFRSTSWLQWHSVQ